MLDFDDCLYAQKMFPVIYIQILLYSCLRSRGSDDFSCFCYCKFYISFQSSTSSLSTRSLCQVCMYVVQYRSPTKFNDGICCSTTIQLLSRFQYYSYVDVIAMIWVCLCQIHLLLDCHRPSISTTVNNNCQIPFYYYFKTTRNL